MRNGVWVMGNQDSKFKIQNSRFSYRLQPSAFSHMGTRYGSRVTDYPSRITDHGFTLLEVLVALALLAIAVTVLIQLFSANLRTIHASEDYVNAIIKANSKLREILSDKELSERSWSEATEDGYTVYVNVYKTFKDRTDDLNVELLEIDLTLKWMTGSKEKSIDLKTMKMMPKKI